MQLRIRYFEPKTMNSSLMSFSVLEKVFNSAAAFVFEDPSFDNEITVPA
jgi:hypothetical protein